MADKEVKIVLTAEDNISSVLKKVTDYLGDTGMGQSVTAISTSFTALNTIMEKTAQVVGYVYGQIASGVNDAAEAENVNKRLAMTLASVGEYSEKTFNQISELGNEIEGLTGISDETIRSLASMGMQMGMTADQSQAAVRAALDLSAATGQDLNTAFRQMSMTLSGSAGRLEKFIPELRNLTKEELENGKAIDVIAKKYEGFAAQTANSFTGATARMDSQIGNIKEAFGRMIAQNPIVIAGIDKIATLFGKAAAAMDDFSTYVLNNAEDIKVLGIAFTVAATAVGGYMIAMNASTAATVALKVAQIALNTVMAASPIGMVVLAVGALTAGFYYLYKNIDLVSGALKVGLGYALQFITANLTLFLTGLSKVVGFFNAEWGKSLEGVVQKIDSVSKGLIDSGKAQMAAAQAAKKSADVQSTEAMNIQRATEGITNKIKEEEQELIKLQGQFSKTMESAKSAFAGVKDLMPRMNLSNFQEDAANWQKKILELKTQAEAMKVKLSAGLQTEEVKEQLKTINDQLKFAEEGLKAIKIKSAMESRQAVIKEEEIRLGQLKAREISTQQEIAQMRLENAKNIRGQLIEIESQRLLQQRGLATAEAQEGISVKQAAQLQANQIELNAYKANLDAQRQLAVDMETQKALALAEIRAQNLSAASPAGMQAQQDLEVAQQQQKQQELMALRQQDLISQQEYESQLTQMRIDQITARTQMETELNNQRVQALGQSPEAQALAIENSRVQSQMEIDILREKLTNEQITEEEFRISKEQSEAEHLERQSQIKEQFIQRDIERNERMKNQWGVTLAKVRLEQEKHGQIMGTIRGIQQSQEFQGAQTAMSNLASLRSSGSKKQFEIGQKAAIAQAMTQTFLGAIQAYTSMSSIPIVGPALGVAAAAAAIMAGMNQVAQIKAQKFQGAAHGGLDEVPKSMNNSTFMLKAGERVVAPQQNKELGEAVDKINNGGATSNTVNITIQGNADESVVSKIKEAVIDAIRERSERGSPILHEKGIVR